MVEAQKTRILEKYQVIPRTLIFIENENDILMMYRNQKDSFGYGKINGVGGHIEQGEDPTESAVREIKEETGLFIPDLELIAIFFIDTASNPGIGLFVYKGETKERKLIAGDEGNLFWIKKNELQSRKDLIKDILFLLRLAESHQDGAKPVIGKYVYDKNGDMRIVVNSLSGDKR